MPTTNIDQRVKRVAGLADADVGLLQADGIDNEEDMRFLQFIDFPVAIPIVKRRKLEIISKYLAAGNTLNAMITIDQVQGTLNAPAAAVGPAGQVHGVNVDPNRGAPKVYTDMLTDFSGDAVDYEDWERKAGAITDYVARWWILDTLLVPCGRT